MRRLRAGTRRLTGPRRRSPERITALTVLARIAFRRGEAGWQVRLDELRNFVEGLESVAAPVERGLSVAEAEAAWISGDLGPIVPRLRAAYSAACREGSRAAIGELGMWLWRAGALSELDERAEEAYLLEVAGRAREAAAVWGQLSVPYEAALSLAGSSDAADVQRAHEELTRLGATAVAHKVALRLRELGSPVPRGPRPTTRANPRRPDRAGVGDRPSPRAGALECRDRRSAGGVAEDGRAPRVGGAREAQRPPPGRGSRGHRHGRTASIGRRPTYPLAECTLLAHRFLPPKPTKAVASSSRTRVGVRRGRPMNWCPRRANLAHPDRRNGRQEAPAVAGPRLAGVTTPLRPAPASRRRAAERSPPAPRGVHGPRDQARRWSPGGRRRPGAGQLESRRRSPASQG